MRTAFTVLQAAVAAFVLTFTFGCAPPAPINVDTSTGMSESDSNMTTSAETPIVETPISETPIVETPAE